MLKSGKCSNRFRVNHGGTNDNDGGENEQDAAEVTITHKAGMSEFCDVIREEELRIDIKTKIADVKVRDEELKKVVWKFQVSNSRPLFSL